MFVEHLSKKYLEPACRDLLPFSLNSINNVGHRRWVIKPGVPVQMWWMGLKSELLLLTANCEKKNISLGSMLCAHTWVLEPHGYLKPHYVFKLNINTPNGLLCSSCCNDFSCCSCRVPTPFSRSKSSTFEAFSRCIFKLFQHLTAVTNYIIQYTDYFASSSHLIRCYCPVKI